MSERAKSHAPAHPASADELMKNIQSLMAEVEALVAGAGGAAEDGTLLQNLQDRFSDVSERVRSQYRNAQKKVVAGARAADETIRSHPYESLAVALGVGVLLGALLRRRD
jgi:ElaB/YqjD/DUF883 family membrane-anchored ribosome-binding protein